MKFQFLQWMLIYVRLRLFETISNVAFSKDTKQWIPHPAGERPSMLAVDGLTSQSMPYCTHTDHDQPYFWWAVDLGDTFKIESVTIFNRQDCCGVRLYNFSVRVYDPATPSWESFNADPGKLCYFHYGQSPSILNLSCDKATVGRYLQVYKEYRYIGSMLDALSLCEVQVYAESGRRGTKYCKQTSRIPLLHLGSFSHIRELQCAGMCGQRENCLGYVTKSDGSCSLYQTSKTVSQTVALTDYYEKCVN